MPSHAGFIIAAYAVTTVILMATIVAIVLDYRSQTRAVARLSSRLGAGVDRETP